MILILLLVAYDRASTQEEQTSQRATPALTTRQGTPVIRSPVSSRVIGPSHGPYSTWTNLRSYKANLYAGLDNSIPKWDIQFFTPGWAIGPQSLSHRRVYFRPKYVHSVSQRATWQLPAPDLNHHHCAAGMDRSCRTDRRRG